MGPRSGLTWVRDAAFAHSRRGRRSRRVATTARGRRDRPQAEKPRQDVAVHPGARARRRPTIVKPFALRDAWRAT
eukprot:scaffold24198_cov73-Phaeocystis_antarctica.AAC.3